MTERGPAVGALLRGAIDYAGLFPPARLGMREAVANYAAYLGSDDAWALGRFVVPVVRLEEFAEAARPYVRGRDPWRVSVTVGGGIDGVQGEVHRFGMTHAELATVDAIEFRAVSPEVIAAAAAMLGASPRGYAELPLADNPAPYIEALRGTPVAAKLRTGGVTPDAFPDPERVLCFLQALLAAGIPFKCTAGLHHPVRGTFPLTYEPASPSGTMHGYLNVMLATAALEQGRGVDLARRILLEERAEAWLVTPAAISWREVRFAADALAVARSSFEGFGSCSFREPLDELALVPAA